MATEHLNTPEAWKAIPDWPGYEVSDQGRVRTYWTPGPNTHIQACPYKMLSLSKNNMGYWGILLSKNKKRKRITVHKLVLLAFVGPCPPGMEACHDDGIPQNIKLSNLRWDTPKNNNHDKINHGTKQMGESHHQCKLTANQVIEIRKLYAIGKYSQQDIANLFDVSRGQVGSIVTRKQWKHI